MSNHNNMGMHRVCHPETLIVPNKSSGYFSMQIKLHFNAKTSYAVYSHRIYYVIITLTFTIYKVNDSTLKEKLCLLCHSDILEEKLNTLFESILCNFYK